MPKSHSWLKKAVKRRPILGTGADVAVAAAAGSHTHPGFATNFAGDSWNVTEVESAQVDAACIAVVPSAAVVPGDVAGRLAADVPSVAVAVDGPYGFEKMLVVADGDAAEAMEWHTVDHNAVAAVAESKYGGWWGKAVHKRLVVLSIPEKKTLAGIVVANDYTHMAGAEGAVTLRTAARTLGHTPRPMSTPGTVPGPREPVTGYRLEGKMALLAAAMVVACSSTVAVYAGKEPHQNT